MMRGITRCSPTDSSVQRGCSTILPCLHPISVRTELVRAMMLLHLVPEGELCTRYGKVIKKTAISAPERPAL